MSAAAELPGGDAAHAFCRQSAEFLREVYMPRLAAALDTLSSDEVWWRPHAGSTSIGNLLLHLDGNVRQWILSGLAGEPDRRERAAEFEAREGDDARKLLDALGATVSAAALVIEGLDVARLLQPMLIQGIETTPLAAVYHVVEHFSWHTGQVTWIAKARSGAQHGIAFYDDAALNAARNRAGRPG